MLDFIISIVYMGTIHISASKKDISNIVLVCGDPYRVKQFAERYLYKYKLVNEIRNALAYTGLLKDTKIKVTVMAHGMGNESMGIYAYELYKFYDVDLIIRFGTCGTYTSDINIGDIVVAKKVWCEFKYGIRYSWQKNEISLSKNMLTLIKKIALTNKNIVLAGVNSSMWFYEETKKHSPQWYLKKKLQVVEMETISLYSIARFFKKDAITFLTVADSLVDSTKSLTSKEREIFIDKIAQLITLFVKSYKII